MVRARSYPLASQVPNAQGVPVADTRILLLGNAGSEALNKILGKPGRTMTRIEDAEQFVKAAPDHDVVVLDAVPPPRTVADLCRELSALPDLVEVPILAIGARMPDAVAVVDLTPMAGHVATHLDIKPKLTVGDLMRDSQGMISPEILRTTYLTKDARGIQVLAGSPGPSTAPLMSGEDATRTLEGLLTAVPNVVVDLGSHLDDRVVASLEAADDVVIVVTPDFPALKATYSFLEYLSEAGPRIAEPTIVVNEVYALQTLTPGDIENALGRRVAIRIPYDPLLYLRAANQGTPVFASAPTSQPARRYDQLAAILLGEDAPTATTETRRRGLAGI